MSTIGFRKNSRLGVAFFLSFLVHLAFGYLLSERCVWGNFGAVQNNGRLHATFGSIQKQEPTYADARGSFGDEKALAEAKSLVEAGGLSPPFVAPELLSSKPFPLDDVRLEPPEPMKQAGVLILRIYIRENGIVDKIEVIESQLPDIYGELAVRAFLRQRFSPGRIGNKAVSTFTEVEVGIDSLD